MPPPASHLLQLFRFPLSRNDLFRLPPLCSSQALDPNKTSISQSEKDLVSGMTMVSTAMMLGLRNALEGRQWYKTGEVPFGGLS